jgi:hypothetical protein
MAMQVILPVLDWKLADPTVWEFAQLYKDALGIKEDTQLCCLVDCMSELALQCHLAQFSPSLIAASTIVYAEYTLFGATAPSTIKIAIQKYHPVKDVEACLLEMSQRLERVRRTLPNLRMIPRKYRSSHEPLERVGLLTIPPIHGALRLFHGIGG